MKKIIYILIILFCLTSCSERSLYQRIDRDMRRTKQDSTIIRMTELFPMQWDTMYVLDALNGIPTEYNKYRIPGFWQDVDISRKIIFVKNSKIIYEERADLVSEEHPVSFNSEIIEYTPQTAVFMVKKYDYGNKQYYTLSPKRLKQ